MNISTKALQVITLIKKAVENSLTGVSFVSIKNYTNKQNEVSNNLINVGINYESAKQKDIEFLENLNLKNHEFKSPLDLLKQAKEELILAFLAPNENRSKGQQDAYTTILPGVRVHNESGQIYLYGYRENKTVLIEGDKQKPVNSAALTIAKDELRKLLRTGKFVNFSLEAGNTIKANGELLEL
jgi:hypothetical protein